MLLSACSGPMTDVSDGSSFSRLFGSIGTESALCSAVVHGGSTTAVSIPVGNPATYGFYVADVNNGLTTTGTAPIRQAEVLIQNSSGTILQCGALADDGTVTLNIPRTAGTYTLVVNSRANTAAVKASVLNNSTSMTPYSITTNFTLVGNEVTLDVTTLPIATHNGTIKGGAFNILDQIYESNIYIRTQSHVAPEGSCVAPRCTSFLAANKVRVFWTPGLSPAAYFGQPTKATSFFIAADEPDYGMATGIYLLGGINGSTCADTDHFDNSVIIHEYGHFLEKDQSRGDSPGGSHNGNSVIDPRLAWSEGWANFLQGAVRGEIDYTDTVGNISCTSYGLGVSLDLEDATALTPGSHDYMGPGTFAGEGIFREVSVARTLWDSMSGAGTDTFGANLGFKYLWYVFSDSTSGFKSSNTHFRNIGYFNQVLSAIVPGGNASDYSDVLDNEYQLASTKEYANPVTITAQPTACAVSISSIAGVTNYARTNDFFQYWYDGNPTNGNITLRYTRTGGSASDLDLWVFREGHILGGRTAADGLVGVSETETSTAVSGVENVSLSGYPAGFYMIQVVAYGSYTATANYYLELSTGGRRLCPTY